MFRERSLSTMGLSAGGVAAVRSGRSGRLRGVKSRERAAEARIELRDIVESSGLEAIADPDATVLILGTLPGAVSLEKRQYYAQPRNAFWSIVAEVTGSESDAPYEERLRQLKRHRLALWDVCAAAKRPGSLDSAIRLGSIRANDFAGFFESHPHVRRICFNGRKASTLFERLVIPGLGDRLADLRCLTLPSTSPAHASMPLSRKIQLWKAALTSREAADL